MTTEPTRKPLKDGVALCLSGGGYRAMLFHLGSLWRLNEVGMLARLARISSVSGGSITSATLGLHWQNLAFDHAGVAQAFDLVTNAIRGIASKTIDVNAGINILIPGRSISDGIISAYDKHLFKGATLQDLPSDGNVLADKTLGPRFVINATNLQTGSLWRFSKPYMADYRIGQIMHSKTKVAVAVAASSAFPPFLSPLRLKITEPWAPPKPDEKDLLRTPPYTTDAILTDGGVYDNMGIETAWKQYKTILVSNAGGKLSPDPKPPFDWARQSKRVLDVIDNQVRSLRARQVVDSFLPPNPERDGAYWSIRTDIAQYPVTGCLPAPHPRTMELANVATRLAALDTTTQERLINWGYAITDAALRCYVDKELAAPTGFPYPSTKI
jgi:NTE family protein